MSARDEATGCPIDPRGRYGGLPAFAARSTLTRDDVELAVMHYGHWLSHRHGPTYQRYWDVVDANHEAMHSLVLDVWRGDAVIVDVAGRFFDANVPCNERLGREPLERLRDPAPWVCGYELHRHGMTVCTADPELPCHLLKLVASYGGAMTVFDAAFDGDVRDVLGRWCIDGEHIVELPVGA